MVTPELLNFIRQSLATGSTTDTIKQTLISQGGWSIVDIDKGISMVTSPVTAPAPSSAVQQTSTPDSASPAPSTASPMSNQGNTDSTEHHSYKSLIITIVIICILIGGYFVFANKSGIPLFPASEEVPSANENIPSINSDLETVAVTTAPKPTLTNSSNCGISNLDVLTSLLLNDGAYITDPVVMCLSQRISSCTPARGTFKTDSSETLLEILKKDDDCSFKFSFTNAPVNSELSSKSISCPMTVASSSLFLVPQADTTDPKLQIVQLFEFGYWGGKVREDIEFQDIRNQQCTGTLIDYYEALYSIEEDNLPG